MAKVEVRVMVMIRVRVRVRVRVTVRVKVTVKVRVRVMAIGDLHRALFPREHFLLIPDLNGSLEHFFRLGKV